MTRAGAWPPWSQLCRAIKFARPCSKTRLQSSVNYQRNPAMPSHPLLQAFKANKPAFGAWITAPGPWVARTVALSSPHVSFLLLDCEHGLTSIQPGAAETIVSLGGVEGGGPSVIVRIPARGPCADGSATWLIKYALDAGAKGIIAPGVSPAELPKAFVNSSCVCLLRCRTQNKRVPSSPLLVSLLKVLEDSAVHSHRRLGACQCPSIFSKPMTTF